MKEKVVFVVINMNIGGTEKALLNMISEMSDEQYDITILMLEKYGSLLDSIPSRVRVKYVKEYASLKAILNNPPKITIFDFFKKGRFVKGLKFTCNTILAKIMKDKTILYKYIFKDVSFLTGQYDVAVAYAGPMNFISYFVVHKVKAKKKVQWIHFDVTKIGFDLTFAKNIYHDFDDIFTVSNEGKDKLMTQLPELKHKISAKPNKVSPTLILDLAEKGNGFDDDFDGIRILTVGRLSKEKGQDLVIPVLAKLKANNYHVRWYCVGEGVARKEYEQLIKLHHVGSDFILLGEKKNPYSFMKQCDIYVQPSRHEGYCMTLAEAKCFKKPIISTNFTGVREHIVDRKTGLIVPFVQDEMYEAIINVMKHSGLIHKSCTHETTNVVEAR